MIADGERLKFLVSNAERRVLLCAPFIKEGVLSTIFSVMDGRIRAQVVTRWRAAEIALGVSDLEVFELVNKRPNSELRLLDDLHAKLYLADEEGLAGSANLTAAALGWTNHSNVELLFPVTRSDTHVARLLRRLEIAEPATYAIRSRIEAEAALLDIGRLDEGCDVSDNRENSWNEAWLPRCAAPRELHAVYEDSQTMSVVEGTRNDGLSDLRDLNIPDSLQPDDFKREVCETLLLMPAFRRIIDQVPRGLTDSAGVAFISELRPNLSQSSAAHQWRIVREWIVEFFQEEFEMAPESFITRLRSRQ